MQHNYAAAVPCWQTDADYTLGNQDLNVHFCMLSIVFKNLHSKLALVLILMWLISNPAAAQNQEADYQQSISDINKEINKLSKDLNSSKASRNTERDKLFLAEKALKQANKDMRDKQAEISALDDKLKQLQATLEKQLSEVDDTRQVLATFFRKRYQNGQADYLKSLLSQENPYAVGRLENYHSYYRRALKRSYQEVVRQIQLTLELQAQVQEQTEQKKREEQALEKLKIEQEKQTKVREQSLRNLDVKINKTQKSLATLQANRARLSSLLEQLKKQAKKLREAEQRRAEQAQQQEREAEQAVKATPRVLVAGGFKKQKGHLQCPVNGKPERRFGARLPESGMKSEGLFYDTQGPKAVRSIFRGRVLFADFLKGYGLLIIVDHGDDHISLYGHNDRLLKRVGDAVAINEHIAQTGVTGGLKSHGLYFEIRHNTNPIDPSKWCK